MKKFVSILLALVMLLSLATTAFADEATPVTYTLTLTNALEGHTYTAYQIFAGDLSEDVLSNIVWGSGVTAAGQAALGDAAAKAESIATTADAEAFAAEVAPYLGEEAGSATVAEGATSCAISGLEAGYYLVKTTATTEENGVYTYYIMKVVANTSAKIKADVPKIDKTVDDNDANIGDTVTFTLTATMPANIQGYETYQMVFHDTMSAGLAYKELVSVTVAGTVVTEGYVVDTVVNADGTTTLTVTFADVLALGAKVSSEIVVTYTAVLDADAVIGTDGNPNEVYLEYSNNPNWDGEGEEPTGETPEVEVIVYTWEIPVFKYTGTDTPLAGAGFTLYKDAECTVAVNLVAADAAAVYKVCTLADCTDHTHVTEILTGETGKFQIEGLEQGTYYLKETTTPAGYNTCDVVTVVIGENGVLNPVEGEDGTVTGEPEIKVLNNVGATLPETGGMGTTVFYVLGAVLVLGAVVLLVTKKRMANAR